jgi:hypothetical protein
MVGGAAVSRASLYLAHVERHREALLASSGVDRSAGPLERSAVSCGAASEAGKVAA